ncbi:MAG TPA: hypothetical protein VK338_01020, partial [Candidatus Nitrosocosmicus sp.]|nr:hypothetical protein [Candidatus Nitrosocosmicus sp.]
MKKTKKIETKPTRRPTKATKIVEAPEINEVEQNEVQASPKTSETKRKNLPMLLLATLALGLIGGYLLTQLYEEKQPAATVNGEVISMDTLNKELVRQGGQKVLENSVTETLIYQEAKKKNISADQKEIDQKIKDIENELKSKG